MNEKPASRIRFVGKIILILGIIALITGLILLLALPSNFAFWLTAGSVILNIVGISLLTLKKY